MADSDISGLTEKTTIAANDKFPMVDEEATPDTTKYISGTNLKSQVVTSGLENPPTEDLATKAPT